MARNVSTGENDPFCLRDVCSEQESERQRFNVLPSTRWREVVLSNYDSKKNVIILIYLRQKISFLMVNKQPSNSKVVGVVVVMTYGQLLYSSQYYLYFYFGRRQT